MAQSLDTYIVCTNSAMNRLNRRARIIVNMRDQLLSIGRHTFEPIVFKAIKPLIGGVVAVKCDSASALELTTKHADKLIVAVVTDTPTVEQLNKLKASKCIALKNDGLYLLCKRNGQFVVKAENEKVVYCQGQSNIIAKTNPIDPGTTNAG